MCGFVFLFHRNRSADNLRMTGTRALQRIVHRGPDERGLVIDNSWLMGHQRLSIVDLQSSRQPMFSPDKRHVLAYNGEVYNYRELRNQLEDEWEFTTQGDTEVVLAGLVRHGPDFLMSMEGMWALALWDSRAKTLLLTRDRMGKKPLYYQKTSNGFACASELPALAALELAPLDEDINSTADYLRYGFYLPGTTAFSGAHEVQAGHFLEWSDAQPVKQNPYWTLKIDRFKGSVTEARELLCDAMVNAARKRMIADVEVGAFLSGGVDSSLVVSLLNRELGISPKTFSIGFTDRTFDERKFARLIARQCATDHYEECLEDLDPQRLSQLILQHVGQPFSDPSLLPTSLVSELASRHVKVALSGDGGDELFSGYQRYQARAILRWYSRLPRPLRKAAGMAVRALPEPVAHHSRSIIKKAHLFIDAANRHTEDKPYIAPSLYSDKEFERLAPDLYDKGHKAPGLPESCDLDCVTQMMYADTLIYMPQDILLKVDRASMAHSLEVRAPFLDREVVELAFSLPRNWHRRHFSGKRMLKETFYDYLPPTLWKRRKQGFSVPVHEWFRNELKQELSVMLEKETGPVNLSFTHSLIKEHENKSRDNGQRLWNIYIYLSFIQKTRQQVSASHS